MNNNKEKKTIISVIKAFDIINYIAESSIEQGVSEIAQGVGFGVSATYHMLNTLKEVGMVTQNNITKKYRLSLKMWSIGAKAFKQNPIATIMQPYLDKLRDETGETANLTLLEGDSIVYIAQAESEKLIKMFTKLGATAPLHCTAAGKLFLAHMDKRDLENLLQNYKLEKYTKNTINNLADLNAELKSIKEKGYAIDDEERDLDVACVAAPIFDHSKSVIACLSISGPVNRFSNEMKTKWIEILTKTAKDATLESFK